MRDTQSLLLGEEGRKGAVDDLRDSQAVQVCLSPDGLNPALLDMEGGALGLAAGIAGLCQGGFPLLPGPNPTLKP